MKTATDPNTLEGSTFQKRPCYRYIRQSDKLPALYATDHDDDPLARVKLFNPSGGGTWYLTEYDPAERRAFGWADLVDPELAELGYISMAELVEFRGQFGLPIERDLHFKPRPLSECR